ncbi:MAG TPA: ATP-binding protein [Microbacterium sp.]|uniref:sensor histidine kinase n=1 Tax=Microbacterium sp. TaxID=51671 RepID=UPI002CF3CF92|nr:ATP-binding protein [Microbacterium sp.]HWI30793.1 ATP-binding protein [Microbacterium sp.]
MDTTQLALLALFLGVIVGAGVASIFLIALRARDRVRAEASAALPDGITAVLEGMDDAAAVVDTSMHLVATSSAAGRLGMTAGGTLDNIELRALVRAARAAGVARLDTLRIRRGGLSAESRAVAARASILSPRLALLIVRDISEQERVEQMRQDFVANTSHELKTPVGAVSLLAEAIESAADDPDQVRSFTARLSAEAARLSRLTSRIMNLSRLQSADELSEVRDVAIDEVITASVESHVVQADSAGVKLVRGGDRGLYVRGDAQVLIEAVGNLLANAIAYSPRGSQVGVGIKATADVVEIAVTDQGIGIAEAEQQRVFERFYRADQARSRRTGGTGLGLAIVKHAVQRHNGDVQLWSRPGRGSTFTIRLPRSEAPAYEPPRKKKRRSSKPKKGSQALVAQGTKAASAKKSAKPKAGASGAPAAGAAPHQPAQAPPVAPKPTTAPNPRESVPQTKSQNHAVKGDDA